MKKRERKKLENSAKKAGDILSTIDSLDQSSFNIDAVAKVLFCHLGLNILINNENWDDQKLLQIFQDYRSNHPLFADRIYPSNDAGKTWLQ